MSSRPEPAPAAPRTPPLAAARRRVMLGLAHKAAAAFGWDETFRRKMQHLHTGCESCADMSDEQLEHWLRQLKRLGADIGIPHAPAGAAKTERRARPKDAAARAGDDRGPLIWKLRAQCNAGGWPYPAYVEGISRRMWGDEAPGALAWHTPKQLQALVASLAYQLKRQARAAKPAPAEDAS